MAPDAEIAQVHAVERLVRLAADACGEEVARGDVGEGDDGGDVGGEVDVELTVGAQALVATEFGDGGDALSVAPGVGAWKVEREPGDRRQLAHVVSDTAEQGGPPYAECVLCREPTEYPESHRGITLCPVCAWQEAQRTAC